MTVETTHASVSSVANGSEVEFYFDFTLYSESDLVVMVSNAVVQNTDYTVSIESDYVGGSVVFDTAPTADSLVELVRVVTLTQTTDLPLAGAFTAEAVEMALDRNMMVMQQMQWYIDNGLSFAPLAGDWAPGKKYFRYQYAYHEEAIYICDVEHISSTSFDDDLAAEYWTVFVDVPDSVSADLAAASAAEASGYADDAEASAAAAEAFAADASVLQAIADYEVVPATGSTGSAKISTGTTAQRDSTPTAGMFRLNSETEYPEMRIAGAWVDLKVKNKADIDITLSPSSVLVSNDTLNVQTTGSPLAEYWLPSTGMSEGDKVFIKDAVAACDETNAVRVYSSAKIHGSTSAFIITSPYYSVEFTYTGTAFGWVLTSACAHKVPGITALTTGSFAHEDELTFDYDPTGFDMLLITGEITTGIVGTEGVISTYILPDLVITAGTVSLPPLIANGSSNDRLRMSLVSFTATGAEANISALTYAGVITGVYGINY